LFFFWPGVPQPISPFGAPSQGLFSWVVLWGLGVGGGWPCGGGPAGPQPNPNTGGWVGRCDGVLGFNVGPPFFFGYMGGGEVPPQKVFFLGVPGAFFGMWVFGKQTKKKPFFTFFLIFPCFLYWRGLRFSLPPRAPPQFFPFFLPHPGAFQGDPPPPFFFFPFFEKTNPGGVFFIKQHQTKWGGGCFGGWVGIFFVFGTKMGHT